MIPTISRSLARLARHRGGAAASSMPRTRSAAAACRGAPAAAWGIRRSAIVARLTSLAPAASALTPAEEAEASKQRIHFIVLTGESPVVLQNPTISRTATCRGLTVGTVLAPVSRVPGRCAGGPCGGKSTALAHLTERLTKLGWKVFAVPEVATLLITGGVNFADMDADEFYATERTMVETQLQLEDTFRKLAEAHGGDTLIVCDRGASDMRAYLSGDDWSTLMSELGTTTNELRDRRYDQVIHLTTAADGAEKFYTTTNNAARTETPAQARELDKKSVDAWLGHPHHFVADNSTDFKAKINRVVGAVCSRIGLPQPSDRIRRFLLSEPREHATSRSVAATLDVVSRYWPKDIAYEDFDVIVSLLRTSDHGSEARLTSRGQNGHDVYTYTVSERSEDGMESVVARQLSSRDYFSLRRQRTVDVPEVSRRERVFAWQKRVYILQEAGGAGGCVQLQLKAEDDSAGAVPADEVLPPFLRDAFVVSEVTGDKLYTTFGRT